LNCRACGYGPPQNSSYFKSGKSAEQLVSVLDLGVQPLPNAFVKTHEPRPGHYPIELMVCPRCFLGQLSVVVDPETLYAKYAYVTSPSATMADHFDKLFDMLNFHQPLHSVVEIGSNDGRLLAHFKTRGATTVCGVDPARNLAAIANTAGIPTEPVLFDKSVAELLRKRMPPIDLILARHVFCHIDDWKSFVQSLDILSSPQTIVCLEMPWANDTVRNTEWDQVYAEHLSYFTIRALDHLLRGTKFHMHHISHYPIHGGTIAVVLRHNECPDAPSSSVMEMWKEEKCDVDEWRAFAQRARDQMSNLKTLVRDLRSQGKNVVGYGAAAKSTVWINSCGFTNRDISGVYDYTPQKLYTSVPGTQIPVVPEGGFYVDNPDYAILWAWNYQDEVMRKQVKWFSEGGKFIIPVPEVKIL